MKIGIAGAGAVGCHYGSKLQQAGCEVVYLVRGEHYQALKKFGLKHESCGETVSLPVVVSDDEGCLADCDVIILSCKTTVLASMCEQLNGVVKKNAVLLTMQNGVTAADVVSQTFPDHGVLAASAFIGVRIEKPGWVIHSAAGHVRLGIWQGDGADVIAWLLKYWQQSDVDAQAVDDIRHTLWHKMLWNCGFNAITALTRRFARDIAANLEAVSWVRDAMSETIKAAQSVGVVVSYAAIDQHIEKTMNMGPVKTSMWQDIEIGRVTEIEVMNAHVVDLARQHGFDAPVNALLTSLIRAGEGTF